ncbi:uncharacterized protein CCR75_008951 [Bremia lactucae]|uniref:Uncharacterized protein n=1 Tax=Bremia lactucae TaxID=4779 RepID=A0A976FRK7_BRELC|nr:hypothetical protein CCR75_008951 [Bremia lactucae]
MLRARVLPDILSQIMGEGITASMLVTLEGALVGAVGNEEAVDYKVVAAIASHTWGEYVHAGKEVKLTGDLRTMLVELEARRFLLKSWPDTRSCNTSTIQLMCSVDV